MGTNTHLAQVLGPVLGLEDAVILGPCVLGHPTSTGTEGPLVLGKGVVVRSGAVLYQGSRLGAGVHIGHGAVVREDNLIGERVSIGTGTQIETGNVIGDRTRIHSGCFLASAHVGADVFIGPNTVFTDDPHPPCRHWPDHKRSVVVGDGASVGGNVTLLPGVQLGAGCLVGGGSVVTKAVDEGMIVAGNPARPMGLRSRLVCEPAAVTAER